MVARGGMSRYSVDHANCGLFVVSLLTKEGENEAINGGHLRGRPRARLR